MSILIDGRPLQTPSRLRGIGRYVGHVMDSFRRDERCAFLFFRGSDVPDGLGQALLSASPRRLITWSDSLYLPPLFRRCGADVYHSTAFALPRRIRGVRLLLTVFDLTLLKFPGHFPWRQRQVARRIVLSARRADLVLPISESTAADLAEIAGVDPARMRVVHPMLDDRLAPGRAVKPPAPLPAGYLLYAGGADGTKNLETLLRALAGLDAPLLVAGPIAAARRAELLAPLAAAARQRVTFLGHVPDGQLSWLYGHAAAFVFPSLNEGFGFPPLEALRCGTPSVVSRAGALPGTLGDAALYVDDPLDAGEWRAKIAALLEQSGLKDDLLGRAPSVLARYAPEAFRAGLARAYDDCLGST
jgi:glycosyltransferase involved in cell wall biosynthesis